MNLQDTFVLTGLFLVALVGYLTVYSAPLYALPYRRETPRDLDSLLAPYTTSMRDLELERRLS